MPQARSYELSAEADRDIESIFDHTVIEFGFDQAVKYVFEFEGCLELLASKPQLGKKRTDIRKGLRSFKLASHIIFYRVMEDRIRVVRVLHASRDLPGLLNSPHE
jgi:toxin ParE1/3/4